MSHENLLQIIGQNYNGATKQKIGRTTHFLGKILRGCHMNALLFNANFKRLLLPCKFSLRDILLR